MRPKLPEGFEYELFSDAIYVIDPKGQIIFLVLESERNAPKVFARFTMTSRLGHNYQEFDNAENAINGMLARWRLQIPSKEK